LMPGPCDEQELHRYPYPQRCSTAAAESNASAGRADGAIHRSSIDSTTHFSIFLENLMKFCHEPYPAPEAGRDPPGPVLRPRFGDVPRPQVREVAEADTGIGVAEGDRSS